MYKKYYSEFLNAHKDQIHMAAHSHHFWPDIAKQGHIESYKTSSFMSDNKWAYIFENLVPEVKSIISKQINFNRPTDLSFASNSHELMVKIISSYFEQDKIKILTTKSEFHSLSRQLNRFSEDKKFEITYINNEKDDFHLKMKKELTENSFDLIIISHVFYNSGLIYPMKQIEELVSLKKDASFILDAYHGYCAVPTDISKISDSIFYMAGGYKYAQAGEGMCFTTIPKNCKLRPQITGWFASFSTFESGNDTVEYDDQGMRFWGSTMDFTAFFRFRAIWKYFDQENISHNAFHTYITELQKNFIQDNPKIDKIIETDTSKIGRFITLKLNSVDETQQLHLKLQGQGVLTDYRGDRLRFGFAPYQMIKEIIKVRSLLG